MLLYVEFISRRPGVSLQDFHRRASSAQHSWAREQVADQIILDVGRTWRIGPEPEYLCVWFSPNHGLERLDDWESLFAAGDHDEVNDEFQAVARIDRAGLYVSVGQPAALVRPFCYLEWLAFEADAQDDDVREWALGRAAGSTATLVVVARPIGLLSPQGLGFVAWGVDRWSDVSLLTAPEPTEQPVRAIDASLYARFGIEQL